MATLIVLVVATALSLLAASQYIVKYRLNQRFSLNPVYVVLIFAMTWLLPAIIHFLSYETINKNPNLATQYVKLT